ncbi:hypothetical protein ABZ912_46865 [Nonomuraea angiospora]|uniref:hypothetical protein n=1 Tax=Nonomuraea angiospora TaxID=46172 RepID=UPI0033EA1CFD
MVRRHDGSVVWSELNHARHLIADDLIELGPALAGGVPPASAGRTVFKTVGVALQDWAIAHLLAQRCLQ